MPLSAFCHFRPAASQITISALGEGNINDTYRVDCEEDSHSLTWLLQRLNTQIFKQPQQLMDNWLLVANHLAAQADYPLLIPQPVVDTTGATLFFDSTGLCWRVFPFFENTYAPERLPTAEEAFEAARAYGIFARSLQGISVDQLYATIPGFHDTDRRWVVFETAVAQDLAGRVTAQTAVIDAMRRVKPIFDQISQLKISGQLPLRATHNDTKAGNVLLHSTTRKAVAVIDWDTIMPGTILSDFGDMVRTFASDQYEDDPDFAQLNLRKNVLSALYDGFLSETDTFLTSTERENLLLGAQWIIGEQVLRFLTDYLAGDPYYKIAYPEHNLIRAQNQLALLDALRKNR